MPGRAVGQTCCSRLQAVIAETKDAIPDGWSTISLPLMRSWSPWLAYCRCTFARKRKIRTDPVHTDGLRSKEKSSRGDCVFS
jgi:hypothetical protein